MCTAEYTREKVCMCTAEYVRERERCMYDKVHTRERECVCIRKPERERQRHREEERVYCKEYKRTKTRAQCFVPGCVV
jgi:hypothetical protein